MDIFQVEVAGRLLTLETGRVAKQASGAVLVSYGDTSILVTATVADKPREGADFLPLTVDFEERLYSVGRIPGGFIKREGRPTEKAILADRLTDRPLRPLFPKKFRNAIHIVSTPFSIDQDCVPEPMAIIGASAALSISKIPFAGPVAAVNVGLVDGLPVINPTVEQSKSSTLNLFVAGTEEAILMIEAGAKEVPWEQVLEAILAGHEVIKGIVRLQKEMVEKLGQEKMEFLEPEVDETLSRDVEGFCIPKIKNAFQIEEKQKREQALDLVKEETVEHFSELYPERENEIKEELSKYIKTTLRSMVLKEGIRPDGRSWEEIRPITSEVGLFRRTHGSGLFTRGQTQVLGICTLGALRDKQILDGLGVEESKRFIHHYNFPPYSVGEAGFMRGPGRRDIGHGALAERAISAVIPSEDEFPYTIRLVSEVLESNGSSSMGSVCASSLSLMDAGVPIKRPVAGIAMGLIKEEDGLVVLSDIQGIEDFLGDMDFKVAGTAEGITALQMDIKIKGLSREILEKALAQSIKGYMFIMDKMSEAISVPRPELSDFAPRIFTMQISTDKIRDVIGPGGKVINRIIEETGAEINIENDGRIFIVAVDVNAAQKAREIIENLTADVEPGRLYMAKITRVEKYGAFAEVLPGKEGLIHISHLDRTRVNRTEDIVNLGDQVMVKVLDIDEKGRINLSRKDALPPGDASDNDQGDEGSRRTYDAPGPGSGPGTRPRGRGGRFGRR